MTIFENLESARPAIRSLRPTQSVVIAHVCQEDQIVLSAEGFTVRPCFQNGWVVKVPS